MECRIGYVIVGVKSLDSAIAFYRDTMGIEFQFAEPEMHWASFKVGGLGFLVPDLDAAYAELSAKGVRFTMGPGKMPWGGSMAMFVDPDGNEFYLNPAE